MGFAAGVAPAACAGTSPMTTVPTGFRRSATAAGLASELLLSTLNPPVAKLAIITIPMTGMRKASNTTTISCCGVLISEA